MQISARVEEHVRRPPDEVFDFATACETFPRVLLPLGPVAGIAHADMLDGSPLCAGARRRIVLTDGSIIDEEILAFDRPVRHRYRWLNPPPEPTSLANCLLELAVIQVFIWAPLGSATAAIGGSLRRRMGIRPRRWVLQ